MEHASPRLDAPPGGLGAKLLAFGRMVRFSHTLFGLPFAMAAFVLALRFEASRGGTPFEALDLLWVVLAFTGARTAAMAFNRIVDRDIDAQNPRTASRELPAGVIGVRTAWALTLLALLVFVGAAAMLGDWPLRLSPLCIAVVLGYSYVKRFSWGAHLVLGVALALAPGGAWIAVTDSFEGWLQPLALMLAVATWVAGFDIIYSLQDEHFDRDAKLHSIPVRFGTRGALWLSAGLHLMTVGALVGLHLVAGLGWGHIVGVGLVGAILIYEHAIVRPDDLSRIDKAFFDLNGWISIAYLGFVLADPWLDAGLTRAFGAG